MQTTPRVSMSDTRGRAPHPVRFPLGAGPRGGISSGANGGTSLAALVPVRTHGAENPMVEVFARSAPGTCTTMRGLARGWTARGLTATQRRPILASPRERSARGVPRSHCLPSWEHPRVSPLALPALAEAEEGAPPWRGGVGRGDERGT
jgi:hypothetical protein